MTNLTALRKEAREEMYVELEAHTRLNGNDPMDADGMELALSYLDTLIDKVVEASEQAIVEGYVEGFRDAKDSAWWKAQDVLEGKIKPHSLMQLLTNFKK